MSQLTLDFDAFTFPAASDLRITGRQEQLVYECLSGGMGYTLDGIRIYMRSAGCWAETTGISARIRDINRKLAGRGYRINHRPSKPGSKLMVYRLEKA